MPTNYQNNYVEDKDNDLTTPILVLILGYIQNGEMINALVWREPNIIHKKNMKKFIGRKNGGGYMALFWYKDEPLKPGKDVGGRQ